MLRASRSPRLPSGGLASFCSGLAVGLFLLTVYANLPQLGTPRAPRRSVLSAADGQATFRVGACTGRIRAGPALNLSSWVAPQRVEPLPRFEPKGCCRDRYALLDALRQQGFTGWAAELGVASGGYSQQILERTQLSQVFSVDMWANDRGHDSKQRATAIAAIAQGAGAAQERGCVLWSKFDDVKHAFPAGLFDFLYIDGYAHTGEEGGRTIREWYSKVRSGGVFGGHDYGTRWPLVKEAVDAWVAEVGLELHVIGPADTALEPAADNDCCPSWFVVKP